VFKITPDGTLTTVYSFCSQGGTSCMDGYDPTQGLVEGTDGNFYGVTAFDGAYGGGTVYKLTRGGTLTTLHSFDGTDGSNPNGVIQATDGNLYGTTNYGGAYDAGTVFKITPGGTLTTLHSFDITDGETPAAALIEASDGNLYGTTAGGGANDEGTVFKTTPSGTLTTLCDFVRGMNGYSPAAPVIQATDGKFYGTTQHGGENGYGTVFEITPRGALTALYSFCSQTKCADGVQPHAGLAQYTSGVFYGTAYGGAYGDGTIYSLSVGLGPFVETVPTAGQVGRRVLILGTNLTGTTSVSFNGKPATFTVVSSTEITATVPSGATTGKLCVRTPHGMLMSNVKFRVTPTISSFSPATGPVGTSVVITGESFKGATCVSFGGVMTKSFTVNSDTEITADVPAGAKTGTIGVTTPGGSAASAGTFTLTM
jgi:uncharacterized repeat protein (TIGR03803 family)